MAFDIGDTVPLTIEIVDAAGAAANAAAVTLTITDPAGAVTTPAPDNPQTGRYAHDLVPDAAGLYRVAWVSTGPATAWNDVVDVRPAAGGVISLADAKQHLNKSQVQTIDDEELRPIIAAAVERVDRHLWTRTERDAGSSLNTRASVSASEILAVKTVLDVYWQPQRSRLNRTASAGASGTAIEADSGPAGAAPLTARLTELLGPPVDGKGSTAKAPVGAFPAAESWPDPALPARYGWWWP